MHFGKVAHLAMHAICYIDSFTLGRQSHMVLSCFWIRDGFCDVFLAFVSVSEADI